MVNFRGDNLPVNSKMTLEERRLFSQFQLEKLVSHHCQCEINYHRCNALLSGCRDGVTEWRFGLTNDTRAEVVFTLLESAPYTTTVDFFQVFRDSDYLQPAHLKVRMYHDVQMAEVIGWNRERRWLPVYNYPNKYMYQPDEKLVLNQFLGELLFYCTNLGNACVELCESIRISKNSPLA